MRLILSLLLVVVVIASASTALANRGYKQINAQQAAAMMVEQSNYIILDVRTPQEYKAKHIKGAINVPLQSIGDRAIPQLPDKDQLIMVYCRSGNRSKQAASKLVKLGYTNIVEFGGIGSWQGATE